MSGALYMLGGLFALAGAAGVVLGLWGQGMSDNPSDRSGSQFAARSAVVALGGIGIIVGAYCWH